MVRGFCCCFVIPTSRAAEENACRAATSAGLGPLRLRGLYDSVLPIGETGRLFSMPGETRDVLVNVTMQLNKGGTTTHSSLDGCVFLLFIHSFCKNDQEDKECGMDASK
ncbi:hypothetical protein CHH60_19895 [Paenibacillus sp. 7523-1]|nr:hypothetical protein CHH60_19895 [Paenibacillus sp. 7523-1]